MSGSVEAGIQQVLAAVGVTGFVHARCIDQDREVALRADEPVLMASLFKITVCLELFRQADAGESTWPSGTWLRRPPAVPDRSGCRSGSTTSRCRWATWPI